MLRRFATLCGNSRQLCHNSYHSGISRDILWQPPACCDTFVQFNCFSLRRLARLCDKLCQIWQNLQHFQHLLVLVAPYRAILRYYRCNTPYRAIPFQGIMHSCKMVRYPPPRVLSFKQAHMCDTPFCSISRDNCAIHHENKHKMSLR